MSNKIGSASGGENTNPNGSEKFAITGSQWISLTRIKTYIQGLFDDIYSTFEHSHTDSDNGGTVAHSVLTGAGTSLHVPAYSSDSTEFLNGIGEWTSINISVYDSDIILQDITTNNADSDNHGFLPKLSGDSDAFLDGKGAWTIPPSSAFNYYRIHATMTDSDSDNPDGWTFSTIDSGPVLLLTSLE